MALSVQLGVARMLVLYSPCVRRNSFEPLVNSLKIEISANRVDLGEQQVRLSHASLSFFLILFFVVWHNCVDRSGDIGSLHKEVKHFHNEN